MAYFNPEGKWWWVEGTLRVIMVFCFAATITLFWIGIH